MQREIKLEKVFAKKRTNGPRYAMIENAWNNVLYYSEEILEDMKANASKISLIQLILQHFCAANNKLTSIEGQNESSLHIARTGCLTSGKASRIAFKCLNYFKKLLQYKTFSIMIASCLRHYNDFIWKSDLAQSSITSIEKTLNSNTTVNIARQIVSKNPSQNVFFKHISHVVHLFHHPKKNTVVLAF